MYTGLGDSVAYPSTGIRTEGVVTVLPGTDTVARRYSSYATVPFGDRASAKQIGAGGYYYVVGTATEQEAAKAFVQPTETEAQRADANRVDRAWWENIPKYLGIGGAIIGAGLLYGIMRKR